MREEVVVIGGGPAGMCAAIEAALCGASVTLLEEKPSLGGQLLKQTHMFFGSKEEFAGIRGINIAETLKKEVEESGVNVLCSTTAVGVFDGKSIGIATEKDYGRIDAERIIVATGAYENTLAFENWDLPGVYGAGGVQTLMNMEGVLPGERFVMVGAGNIGLIVSYQLIQAGADVVCVVEAMDKVGGYEVHAAKLRRLGVPILLRHTVIGAVGEEVVEGAIIAELGEEGVVEGTEFRVDCDAICVAVGLSPMVELLAQAGCRMEFVPELGGYVVWHNENQRTSLEHIYVAGDASGIEEASTAMLEGRIAGISAALSLGKRNDYDAEEALRRYKMRLAELRAGPFGEKTRKGKSTFGIELLYPKGAEKVPLRKEAIRVDSEGAVAVLECPEPIPCNPCVEACPYNAIRIDGDINGIPSLVTSLCRGCGRCIVACPGLAIFLVNRNYSKDEAEIAVPYEMLPELRVGDAVTVTANDGEILCEGRISRVRRSREFDRKKIVYFVVPKEYADKARGFLLPNGRECGFVKKTSEKRQADDVLICRCEDVMRSDIEALVDAGYESFDEIKRILRCGMGACQGRGCQRHILGIIARRKGRPLSSLKRQTARSPVRPLPLSVFAETKQDDESVGRPKECPR